MKIKYPRFSIHGKPADFYLFYQESEQSIPKNSGWIKGNSDLYYKLKKMKNKDLQYKIESLLSIKGE